MSGTSPILSVVIPSSNSAEFLPRCLASLGDAKANRVEVIVIDNASVDRTPQIVEQYSQVVSRFVSERDRGQSDALNKGYAEATGAFVCWLNSDDEFVPGALRRTARMLEGADGDWYTAGMVWIDTQSRIIRCSPQLPHWSPLRQLGMTGVGGPSSFLRRQVAAKAGRFDESLHYCMDIDMWHRLHRNGIRLQRLPWYAWAFRIHQASKTSHVHLTGSLSDAMSKEILGLYEKHGVAAGPRMERLRLAATRIIGAASLRDAFAAMDTWRFREQPLSVLATP